jgi:hypothetical protein
MDQPSWYVKDRTALIGLALFMAICSAGMVAIFAFGF